MKVLSSVELSSAEFETLRALVLEHTGISLSEAKVELVKRRFTPRLRELNLKSFSSYIKYIKNDHGEELLNFADAITTNLTSFFRENHHFEYLKSELIPELVRRKQATRRLRFWSAGCSTGQEAYTLAMLLHECIPGIANWDVRILATDLDRKCLEKGRNGIYNRADVEKVPGGFAHKWFVQKGDKVQVKQPLRQMVTFNHLNLMNRWPVSGPFDAIFCRNVFIYFDKHRQKACVEKFAQVQNRGDHLFIGHSESIADLTNDYKLTGQTIYVRQ